MLHHTVITFLIYWGISILFSIVVSPIYIFTSSVIGSLFSMFLPILVFSYHLITAIMTDRRLYLMVVLIFISLIVSSAYFHVPFGHLYVFFGKCLFRSSAHFFFFLYSVVCLFDVVLYEFLVYFAYLPLLRFIVCKYILLVSGWPVVLLISFPMQKLFSLM